MRKLIVAILLSGFLVLLSSFSVWPSGETVHSTITIRPATIDNNTSSSVLYNSLRLQEKGLSKKAFDYAYKGYLRLVKRKIIDSTCYLTICDFSQSSRNKRLYLIDMTNREVLMQTYVAHGRNSGHEFATRFSNRVSSLQSSLGFYVTKNSYNGEHGLSLRMQGLEPGFNDKAYRRAIVIHGADYIGDGSRGRSYGCPAVPRQDCATLINTIKEGSCVFIYHPSRTYLLRSKILNG